MKITDVKAIYDGAGSNPNTWETGTGGLGQELKDHSWLNSKCEGSLVTEGTPGHSGVQSE